MTNVNGWRKSGTPLILIPQNFGIQRPTCDEAEDDLEENDESGQPYLILEVTKSCLSNPYSKMKSYHFCQEFKSSLWDISLRVFSNGRLKGR